MLRTGPRAAQEQCPPGGLVQDVAQQMLDYFQPFCEGWLTPASVEFLAKGLVEKIAASAAPIELTEEMVAAALVAYNGMVIADDRSDEPRDTVVAIILSAFAAQPSGLRVHFRGRLTNTLYCPDEP